MIFDFFFLVYWFDCRRFEFRFLDDGSGIGLVEIRLISRGGLNDEVKEHDHVGCDFDCWNFGGGYAGFDGLVGCDLVLLN